MVGVTVGGVVVGDALGLDVGDTTGLDSSPVGAWVAGTSTSYVLNAGSNTKGVHVPKQQ